MKRMEEEEGEKAFMQYAQRGAGFWEKFYANCTNGRGLEFSFHEPNFSIRLLSPIPTLPLIFLSEEI
jgi:hypothetical protein